jgi:hypothetical protein
LEASARAEALKHSEGQEQTGRNHSYRNVRSSTTIRIEERTFEISELCRIFLGRWMKYFFTFTTAGDLYGITWALAVVFASSFADDVPMGTEWDYELYVAMFVVVCVPLSCL